MLDSSDVQISLVKFSLGRNCPLPSSSRNNEILKEYESRMWREQSRNRRAKKLCRGGFNNDPVSIRNLHNLTRPDNMDNQAASRYVGQQPARVDAIRRRRGAVKTWSVSQKKLRQLPGRDKASPKPRLVMVEWDISWRRKKRRRRKVNRRLCSMSSNLAGLKILRGRLERTHTHTHTCTVWRIVFRFRARSVTWSELHLRRTSLGWPANF